MRADRSRRSGQLARLGACLAVMAALSLMAESAGAWATGSNCTHPWTATYQVGGPGGGFEGDQHAIYMSGTPRSLSWVVVRPRSIVCSVRIQLADGRSVAPTKLLPYSTPTPTGGEYKAPHGSHSPLRQIIVTAARSPVPPGSSCNYPVLSSQSVDGAPSNGSDTKDYSVKVKVVSETNPGEPKPGAFMTLRLVVTIHNPRIEICRAVLTVFPLNPEGFIRAATAEAHPVVISPGGTVSSGDVVVPATAGYAAVAYARLK